MAGAEADRVRGIGVYLASPLGFTSYGKAFNARVVEAVLAAGFEPRDPWSTTEGVELARLIGVGAGHTEIAAANAAVGQANVFLIDTSSALLACLDGADVDSGTAAEIGYASAQGKPTVGYRLDSRLTGEDITTVVSLQVEHFVRRNGGSIHRSFESALDALQQLFT